MNLIVDIGNTLVKFAVFQQNTIIEKKIVDNKDAQKTFKKITKKFPSIEKSIVSSVGKLDKSFIETIGETLGVLSLDHDTRLPFNNLYETPKTLGVDRIALVSAAIRSYPKANVLIIDAGTCITYDFITEDANYLGGAISPGIRLRYKSLNTLTANLPLLDTEMPEHLIGTTTAGSIHSGVVNGVLKEIEGVIEDYQKKYKHLTVILTGGDSNFLSKQLKNGIFANSNFLLEGLNYILEFNSH